MKRLLVATTNKKKLQEIKSILRGLRLAICSLSDYPDVSPAREDAESFSGNAVKKALKASRATGMLSMGEDSGLCVPSLNGLPGVRSARFAGRDKNDDKNNRKLLRLLDGKPKKERTAYYVCAVAIAYAGRLVGVVEGDCRGYISLELRGATGFGYDPLFVIPAYGKTFAQLGPRIKHRISHRYKALKKARRLIAKALLKKT